MFMSEMIEEDQVMADCVALVARIMEEVVDMGLQEKARDISAIGKI